MVVDKSQGALHAHPVVYFVHYASAGQLELYVLDLRNVHDPSLHCLDDRLDYIRLVERNSVLQCRLRILGLSGRDNLFNSVVELEDDLGHVDVLTALYEGEVDFV